MSHTSMTIAILTSVVAASVASPSVAQDARILRSEFIFETAPFPSVHASTIVATTEGLVAAWFGGKGEGAEDVGIWSSRQLDGK